MKMLNPTLWRTCRMLAGSTRIQLLRELHDRPGQNIAALAKAVGISQPYASQEMRRIQSRGFLRPVHQGASLIYQPAPDPQVASAAPLLKAVLAAMEAQSAPHDADISRIAAGLSHERRIALVRSLLQSSKTTAQLRAEIPMAPCSFDLHLRTLIASGFVQRQNRTLSFQVPNHPVAKALARLLRQGAAQ
ncbi:MAG: winged helix-turn-helix domain-containing protein [Kiritimatiellae bacterium]|jgi:DNA-binding HxlR family transcriptional regulator|nr:winged helix-turn-helix domain-containing protein [Kiritimatiellia bacterium]MDD4118574.1 winged helix-turn-helix domain-containing protein [Kiritimatiellia bacterium]